MDGYGLNLPPRLLAEYVERAKEEKFIRMIRDSLRKKSSEQSRAKISALREKQREGGKMGAAGKHRNLRLLEQWINQQNPGTRRGNVFARELLKGVPKKLLLPFSDPERVIRDYLNRRLEKLEKPDT